MSGNTKANGTGAPVHLRRRMWSWGERARTRISELEAICKVMRDRPQATNNAERLAKDACEHLQRARQAVNGSRPRLHCRGAAIDVAETNINAATCLLLRYMPPKDLAGRLPDIRATLDEHLPSTDKHKLAVEEVVRTLEPQRPLNETEREIIVTATRTALWAQEREYLRVRSFRNIVYLLSGCLILLAGFIGAVTAAYPQMLPMCFHPEEKKVVCPTKSTSGIDSNKTMDAHFEENARRVDYIVIEVAGLIAAAVAAAVALRQIGGTSVPYSVPVALALLKLPTGALTAVLGLLLMRGDFVPGLSNLDSSAQIIAWAVVFGYAQQLFTRLIDQRGQAVLNAVGAAENPSTLDQRLTAATFVHF